PLMPPKPSSNSSFISTSLSVLATMLSNVSPRSCIAASSSSFQVVMTSSSVFELLINDDAGRLEQFDSLTGQVHHAIVIGKRAFVSTHLVGQADLLATVHRRDLPFDETMASVDAFIQTHLLIGAAQVARAPRAFLPHVGQEILDLDRLGQQRLAHDFLFLAFPVVELVRIVCHVSTRNGRTSAPSCGRPSYRLRSRSGARTLR